MEPNIAGSATPHQSNPSRSFDPLKGKAKARLRLEIAAIDLPHKALAIGLRTSDAQLSRILAEHCPDDLPAYKAPAVTRELGPGFMEWLAVQCGGTYIHNQSAPTNGETVSVLVGLLARQSGATVQELIQDMADHVWTPQERAEALPGLRKLGTVINCLIHQAEVAHE